MSGILIANHSFSSRLLPIALVVCLLWAMSTAAFAGGGPENVLLVVNRKSSDSLTIANHYIRLRQIPPGNVLTLAWDPKQQSTTVDEFRKKILGPIFQTITQRRLQGQIDYIIYSSDFPWTVTLKSDVDRALAEKREAAEVSGNSTKEPKWPDQLKPTGSINGLTYLWESVLQGKPLQYMELQSNRYTRLPIREQEDMPSLNFKSTRKFGPRGEVVETDGRGYMLSMMLAVTSGRGNTVAEVLNYLTRSATADGTHPKGTIYYMKNNDDRSKPRHDLFPAAVEKLRKLGVSAELIEGKLPVGKQDVQGTMVGLANFNWRTSRSTILPGAICEHFTSFGGKMYASKYQTPLSEFLRYGAAGASGTVVEPYALPWKFPAADIHVHYARGCTLAEAFYQSVHCPYQLLIVGDPLCRPWARIPQLQVEGIEPDATVRGNLTLTPSATVPGGSKVARFQLFIDGWVRTECAPGETLDFDTTRLADGYHELRVVAIEAGLIRCQGRTILPITTANYGRTINASMSPQGKVSLGSPLVISASSPGSKKIYVLHNSRLVGQIAGEQGVLEVNPATLGVGPVQLRVVGIGDGKSTDYAWAKPLAVTIEQF